MKLHTASLLMADLPDMMASAGRPEMHDIWTSVLYRLRQPGTPYGGVRFRPKLESCDWCVAKKSMIAKMAKTGQNSLIVQKDDLYLARLHGALDVLYRHPVLCKLDEAVWDEPFGNNKDMWGGFPWENPYYVGNCDPWEFFSKETV